MSEISPELRWWRLLCPPPHPHTHIGGHQQHSMIDQYRSVSIRIDRRMLLLSPYVGMGSGDEEEEERIHRAVGSSYKK